jgi:hypothetical protein
MRGWRNNNGNRRNIRLRPMRKAPRQAGEQNTASSCARRMTGALQVSQR